jgi:hypothetical protein
MQAETQRSQKNGKQSMKIKKKIMKLLDMKKIRTAVLIANSAPPDGGRSLK